MVKNFVQVLIRMPSMEDKYMGNISTLVQNFPEQARIPLKEPNMQHSGHMGQKNSK